MTKDFTLTKIVRKRWFMGFKKYEKKIKDEAEKLQKEMRINYKIKLYRVLIVPFRNNFLIAVWGKGILREKNYEVYE